MGFGTGNQETVRIASTTYNSVTLVSPTANAHSSGDTCIAATHDVNSIAAYGYRIYNFVDFYLSSGSSDSAESLVYNLLNTRKAKSSSGTFSVSGYCPQHRSIKPGYIFAITDPTDVYQGSATIDSSVTGWIADSISYDIVNTTTGGFTVSYTVEPYYAAFQSTSPDKNQRDLFARRNRSLNVALQRLNSVSLPGGVNSKK